MTHAVDRYKNGQIYKLVSAVSDLVYIGSTCKPLRKRLGKHKNAFKRFCEGKGHRITSFQLFEKGNVDIILIEKFECTTKDELHSRERYYIETMKCVNKCIPMRLPKEWRFSTKEEKKDYDSERYNENKEKILEYHKRYYNYNKDVILKQMKVYREANKDKISKKIKEIVICSICSSKLTRNHLLRHQKTKKCRSKLPANDIEIIVR